MATNFVAAYAGHHHVNDCQVRRVGQGFGQPVCAVSTEHGLMSPALLQQQADHPQKFSVVVNDQYIRHARLLLLNPEGPDVVFVDQDCTAGESDVWTQREPHLTIEDVGEVICAAGEYCAQV